MSATCIKNLFPVHLSTSSVHEMADDVSFSLLFSQEASQKPPTKRHAVKRASQLQRTKSPTQQQRRGKSPAQTPGHTPAPPAASLGAADTMASEGTPTPTPTNEEHRNKDPLNLKKRTSPARHKGRVSELGKKKRPSNLQRVDKSDKVVEVRSLLLRVIRQPPPQSKKKPSNLERADKLAAEEDGKEVHSSCISTKIQRKKRASMLDKKKPNTGVRRPSGGKRAMMDVLAKGYVVSGLRYKVLQPFSSRESSVLRGVVARSWRFWGGLPCGSASFGWRESTDAQGGLFSSPLQRHRSITPSN